MSNQIADPPPADLKTIRTDRAQRVNVKRSPAYRTPILERVVALFAIDLVCVLAAASIAFGCWTTFSAGRELSAVWELLAAKWMWLPIVACVWVGAAWITDLYDAATSGISAVVAQRSVMATAVSVTVFFGLYFFFPEYIPRTFFLIYVSLVAVLSVVGRSVYHAISDKRLNEHRIMLIGDRLAARELHSLLTRIQRLKLRLVAWSGESELTQSLANNNEELLDFAMQSGIDEIVVSSTSDNDKLFRELVECQSNGIRVSSMAELYRKLSRQIPVKYVDSTWVLSALQDRLLFTRVQMGIKRVFDIVGALVALPILIILFPFIAIAIRLDSAGPIFYRQIRAGRAGRRFSIIKFRTMGQDAERDGKARWASDNDPRITKVGNFLRKTRLDELPQFFNVLVGDMSLVGPRPERPEIEEHLEKELPHYFIRRLVKPGITGWAQVHYKYGNTVEDSLRKLQYDAYYVRYWSVPLDLYTIIRTVGVMLGSRGQ